VQQNIFHMFVITAGASLALWLRFNQWMKYS